MLVRTLCYNLYPAQTHHPKSLINIDAAPPWYPLSGVSISASLVIRQLQLQGTSGDTGQIMGVWWVWLHSCSADQPSNTWSYSSRLSSDWANCVKQWFTFVYDNCPKYLNLRRHVERQRPKSVLCKTIRILTNSFITIKTWQIGWKFCCNKNLKLGVQHLLFK